MPDMLPLMDRVHAMTFASKIQSWRVNPKARRALARQRMQLRRAEKYIINDDTVKLICHLSHEIDRLEAWSFLARLQFDCIWIELDLHTKVRELYAMDTMAEKDKPFNPSQTSPVIGYLLYRDDPGSLNPRWVAHQYYEDPSNSITPGIIAYVFDPEGSDADPCRGSTSLQQATVSLRKGFKGLPTRLGHAALNDREIKKLSQDIIYADAEFCAAGDFRGMFRGNQAGEGAPVTSSNWALTRSAVIAEPFWLHTLPEKKLDEVLEIECREEIGHLRWLVTLLAALNSLPRDTKPINVRTGTRTVGANILPYMQHHSIGIKLPRDNRVVWAKKKLDTSFRNAPKPWHRVRGHWRIVEYGKAPNRLCRHLPTMVEHGLGMCERCQLLIRWIPDHHRGDPNIGIVEHTYKVHT